MAVALLGKITEIATLEAQAGMVRLRLTFTPVCTLPARQAPPAWLHGAVLTIARTVADPREVGVPGDSLVLSPAESARWLAPLRVEPAVVYGHLPERLHLALHWWPEREPPRFTVQANGRQLSGPFLPHGDGYAAEVATEAFFAAPPTLPVSFTVTCGAMTATGTVLPAGVPFVHTLPQPAGEEHWLENDWYRLTVISRTEGGAISTWVERGRGVDHFQRPENRIGVPLVAAGHTDWYRMRWQPSRALQAVTLESARGWREGGASRLAMAGEADSTLGLRTTVECALFDEVPLLLWRRGYQFAPTPEKPPHQPSEPIDAVRAFGPGFRAAWRNEDGDVSGSRLLTAYGDQLVVLRTPQTYHPFHGMGWQMDAGWVLAEHPGRRCYFLYLFDLYHPPHLVTDTTPSSLIIEPTWPMSPARPGDTFGLALAMSAGECAGAGTTGAWIGCRAVIPGGIRCAVVGRLRTPVAGTAVFTLGASRQKAPLHLLPQPSLGDIFAAVADFPGGRLDDSLEITVADVPTRRPA